MTPQSRKMVNKATALAESLVERIGILVIITSVIQPAARPKQKIMNVPRASSSGLLPAVHVPSLVTSAS